MDKFLIVRLSSLGDIIHAIPVAAALRDAFPSAQIDWLLESRYRELVESVAVLDHVVDVDFSSLASASRAVKAMQGLRKTRYDCAIDVQGLLRSAVIARCSGATRTVGFSMAHVREKAAVAFYTDLCSPQPGIHRVQKNLALLKALDISTTSVRFPLTMGRSKTSFAIRSQLQLDDQQPFALLIPGAGWPNRRWPVTRFGAIAEHLRNNYSIPSVIDAGNGDERLAFDVVASSAGSAHVAPRMSIVDLVEVTRSAAVVVSADTGPLHIAAAIGTPIVGIFGPTDPKQSGPMSTDDEVVLPPERCRCPYKRRCTAHVRCIEKIEVGDVIKAIDRRLARVRQSAFSA